MQNKNGIARRYGYMYMSCLGPGEVDLWAEPLFVVLVLLRVAGNLQRTNKQLIRAIGYGGTVGEIRRIQLSGEIGLS